MSQGSLVLPTTGVVSGLSMAVDVNNALDALVTQSSGSSAPTNAVGSAPELGQMWLDTTSATLPILKQYNGTTWVVLGSVDVTNNVWTPPLGGGAVTTLASASTTDLGSKAQSCLTVSGTTTITSFGSSAAVGSIKVVTFSGALTLTYNGTSLILPTAANITTAAGDVAWFTYLGSGNWKCISYQLASGAPLSTTAVGAQQLIASAQGMNSPLNLQINATVSGNALTVAIKGANGSNPSASNPVLIPFRDATIANGDPVIASLQSALSFSTPTSGNTIGAQSGGIAFRLWVCLYYNGGTPAVGVFNASSVTSTTAQIFPLPEQGVVTTAASTNGGSSLGTHYANVSAITNTPFRIIGYLEWASGLTTAGTWASAPTSIVLFGPGIKKPGDIVQSPYISTSSRVDFTGALTNNATTPTNSNGTQALSQAITPSSAANILNIRAGGTIGTVNPSFIAIAVLDNSNAAIGGNSNMGGTSSGGGMIGVELMTQPNSTSALTYKLYGYSITGTSVGFNNTDANTLLLNGKATTYLGISEIMG